MVAYFSNNICCTTVHAIQSLKATQSRAFLNKGVRRGVLFVCYLLLIVVVDVIVVVIFKNLGKLSNMSEPDVERNLTQLL